MKIKLIAAATAVSLTALVSGCGESGNSTTVSYKDGYGIGAVTTVRLLQENVSPEIVLTLAETAVAADGIKSECGDFDRYFTALGDFFDGQALSAVTEENTDSRYPYEIKLTISGRELNGITAEYVMYYSETVIKQESDGGETETEYSLGGVMVSGGKEYLLEGGRKFESEEDETENELKIRAYADKNDRQNYIEMRHENSEESDETETEYVYRVYSGGKLYEQTSVKFESETKNNKQELEYELKFVSGDAKGKYKIEKEIKNSKTEYKVKYDLNGESGQFKIYENADGSRTYKFSDGSEIKY